MQEAKPLSDKQRAVLLDAFRTGTLNRKRSGWHTPDGQPSGLGHRGQTVYSLASHGLLTMDAEPACHSTSAKITSAGINVAVQLATQAGEAK